MTAVGEKAERGLSVIAEMMNPAFSATMRGAMTSDTFGSTLARFGVEHSFADVWARPGMERKQRSLVLIGALIAMRQPDELRNHIRIGLNNGLSIGDIEEAMITTSPYVGLPAISTAYAAIIDVLRELGHLPDVQTAKEKGLL